MPVRTTFVARGFAEDSQAETISFQFVCPANCTLVMIIAHWDGVPAATESLVLQKDAAAGPEFDTVFVDVDPNDEALTDYVNSDPFHLFKDDVLTVNYPNTDDQNCSCEIMLRQT